MLSRCCGRCYCRRHRSRRCRHVVGGTMEMGGIVVSSRLSAVAVTNTLIRLMLAVLMTLSITLFPSRIDAYLCASFARDGICSPPKM